MPKPKPLLDWDEDEDAPTDAFEEKVYGVLLDAMNRSDAAAKAIARIQNLLHDQQTKNEEQPTLDPAKLAEQDGITTTVRSAESGSSGEFDQGSFYDMFMGINTMKLVKSMLNLLDLNELQDEVMSTMVDTLFGRSVSGGGRGMSPQTEVTANSEMELLLTQVKKAAERNERSKKRA